MQDLLTISLDGLREGEEIPIEIVSDPQFLDVQEADLGFESPVEIQGSALLNRDSIVISLAIRTEATMSCAICNENIKVKIEIPHFCHMEERGQGSKGLFSLRDIVRDSILLELPFRAECNSGCCRERATLAKFLKQNQNTNKGESHGSPT